MTMHNYKLKTKLAVKQVPKKMKALSAIYPSQLTSSHPPFRSFPAQFVQRKLVEDAGWVEVEVLAPHVGVDGGQAGGQEDLDQPAPGSGGEERRERCSQPPSGSSRPA